jgi:hypothetical protein
VRLLLAREALVDTDTDTDTDRAWARALAFAWLVALPVGLVLRFELWRPVLAWVRG